MSMSQYMLHTQLDQGAEGHLEIPHNAKVCSYLEQRVDPVDLPPHETVPDSIDGSVQQPKLETVSKQESRSAIKSAAKLHNENMKHAAQYTQIK